MSIDTNGYDRFHSSITSILTEIEKYHLQILVLQNELMYIGVSTLYGNVNFIQG